MSETTPEEDSAALVRSRPEVAAIASEPDEASGVFVDPTILAEPRLPHEARAVTASRQMYAERFTSPLPPPEVLERYSRVPGALEQILRVLEKQQDHSHAMDKEEMAIAKQESSGAIEDAKSGRVQARWGQLTGTLVCLASIAAGAIVCIYGNTEYAQVAGGFIGLGGPATVVAILVTGRHPKEGTKSLPAEAAKVYTDTTVAAPLPPSVKGNESPALRSAS